MTRASRITTATHVGEVELVAVGTMCGPIPDTILADRRLDVGAHIDRGECRLVSRNGHVFKSWPGLGAATATGP